MMKKNLFLLFSIYFFVLQAVFVGFLRGETKFFLLAAINLIFILFIALLSKDKIGALDDNTSKEVEKIHKIKKKKNYKPIHHIWFFVISILFGFFVWFWLGEIVLHLQLLVSITSSFVLFTIFGFLFKFRSFKVREGKIYMLVLVGLLLWSSIRMFGINFLSENKDVDTNTGTNFVSVDADISGQIEDVVMDQDLIEMDLVDPYTKATFHDVILSLLSDMELNTKQNIKFSYISYSNENYPYYRTAYEKKMIGKTINPDKELFCETYVVMKGLVEGRSVGSYGDIKLAYWNYAKNNDLLPECKYGEYLTIGDIK